MRLSEVERKARASGIKNTWVYCRKDLVRLIQRTEGNTPCFGTLRRGDSCPQFACCWREDCLK